MFAEMTLKNFLDETWSDSPAPGGGSIAAMSGATAAALAGMVANLTLGKAKYAEVQEEMAKIAKETDKAKYFLLSEIDRDTEAFNKVMECFSMPKETAEEKAARKQAIQEKTKGATEVPLGIARESFQLMELIQAVVMKGNANAVTDGCVAAMMARTSVLAALYNVKINLGSIKDEAYVAQVLAEVETLEKAAIEKEQEILAAAKV